MFGIFNLKKKSKKDNPDQVHYASFNRRLIAFSLDLIMLILVLMPINIFFDMIKIGPSSIMSTLQEFYGSIAQNQAQNNLSISNVFSLLSERGLLTYYIIVSYIMPFGLVLVYILYCWIKFSATPGKMLTRCVIVDYPSFDTPSKKQYVLRFLGYFLSALPLGLGFFMVALNKHKRGLHDYIAGTAVVVRLHKLKHKV
jgi:uncharacterized RDD family membrane protein YckC